MSGDSPNSHRDDVFEFKEIQESAGPSKEPAAQSGTVVQASVLVEPDKPKEEDEKAGLCSAVLNNSTYDDSRYDQDKTVRVDELSYTGKKGSDDDDEKDRLNGNFDNVDSIPLTNQTQKKPLEEDEEDNCTVKCLYYTLACCECVIV